MKSTLKKIKTRGNYQYKYLVTKRKYYIRIVNCYSTILKDTTGI